MKIERLNVKYHNRLVGTLSLTPDDKLCAFEYAPSWIAEGFSISPLELPLRQGLFLAKPSPFHGNFGIFEDSLPDGYGRYLLHKLLQKEGIDDFKLSALDRLSFVDSGGMGALTFQPETILQQGKGTGHPTMKDFIAVGTKIKMNEQRRREIIDKVSCNCYDLTRYTIDR